MFLYFVQHVSCFLHFPNFLNMCRRFDKHPGFYMKYLSHPRVEKICESVSMSLNRNAVHGDTSALSPGGVRIGSPAMTTRGCPRPLLAQGDSTKNNLEKHIFSARDFFLPKSIYSRFCTGLVSEDCSNGL